MRDSSFEEFLITLGALWYVIIVLKIEVIISRQETRSLVLVKEVLHVLQYSTEKWV